MPGMTNEEMRERLKEAIESGKMPEEQYLRNLEKFPVEEPEPEDAPIEEDYETEPCPTCDFEIVKGSPCPFCGTEEDTEFTEDSAETPETLAAMDSAETAEPIAPVKIAPTWGAPEPEIGEEELPDISDDLDSEKGEKVTEYVDKLISLGIKPAAQREALIVHYLEFDEAHMQKEVEFNDVHTDVMKYFVETNSR